MYCISFLLLIGRIEINPGLGSTSGEEISPMEIEDSIHDTFDFSSENLQRTPISSQVVPMASLDLSSECSCDVPMTPEKGLSIPKSGKRKGYQARKNRNRASMKKRRVDDADFRKTENETRLKRFNYDYEDSDFRAKHSENQLASITKRLRYPDNCAVYTTQGKIPKIALCRGLMFLELPPELTGLSAIEQRLVSPRHEFMNIRSLGRERQQGLHGMVVNIPINTEQSVNQLPRKFSQSQTIQLQLFRKLSYAKPYLYETIRPRVVLEAARYLSTTELCKFD